MEEQRKRAILFAATLLCAEDDQLDGARQTYHGKADLVVRFRRSEASVSRDTGA
jgi:hypothetical protein